MTTSNEALERIDQQLQETVLTDDWVFCGGFLQVHRQCVRLPDARTAQREMIRHPGAAAMVVLDEDDCLVMERQWRAPVGCAFWEIPAGKIDAGETPLQTAERELAEETGLAAEHWDFLGTIHNAIGYSNEHIEIFLARGLSPRAGALDDNEFVSVHRLPREQVMQMSLDGRITDVKTLTALYWLDRFLAGRKPAVAPFSSV